MLNALGLASSSLGQYSKAIEYYEQSLAIFQDIGDRQGEAGSLNDLGEVYRNRGQYPKAIEYYEQSLAIFQDIGDRNGTAGSLHNLGLAYLDLGQYPKAIEYYEQSLAIFQDIGDRNGEASSLNNLGEVYRSLGQYPKAIEYYEQALAIQQDIDDLNGAANSLGNLGLAYSSLGQYLKVTEFYQPLLEIFQYLNDRNGEASLLNALGLAYFSLGKYPKAIEYYEQALAIQQDIDDLNGAANSLGNLGLVYSSLGQYPKAIEYYQQSLAIFQNIGDREGEGLSLSNIGKLLADQNQPEAAIVFLKQSVNVREAIRQDNRSLSQELQQSYTDTVAVTYRQLSELLLAQGRILEAQQVLELLKLQELRDFTGVRARVTANGIELTPAEQVIIDQHNSLIAFGQQINQCRETQCGQLTALLDQRDQLTQQFNATLQAFDAEMRARLAQDRGALNTQEFKSLAIDIVEAQPGTVMIYAVVLDDKLWLLWATAGRVVNSVEVPVTRQQLGEKVLQFRQLLSTPNSDITQVQATAKQLYDWLIAPIAPELQKNQIQHLVFSLDRVTRYIPMAALFDGQHYLIENYTVSTVLSAGLTRVDDRLPLGTDQTSVLALGLSNPVPPEFPGLPNVPAELNAIVRSADDPQGIYPGLKFLNQQFDENTLRNNLFGHQIVHIATHGVFVPGRQDQSYLVLGNGQQMSISRIQELQDLGDVKLVVLSACQTALGEPDQDGLEIAGIAYYFLNGGANTVMASLWAVNDTSTQQLMQHLYANLAQSTSQVPVTRAEALRQAQLSLLQGSTNAAGNADRSIVGVRPVPGAAPSNAASPGLSHPYYWAPFILIGNGL